MTSDKSFQTNSTVYSLQISCSVLSLVSNTQKFLFWEQCKIIVNVWNTVTTRWKGTFQFWISFLSRVLLGHKRDVQYYWSGNRNASNRINKVTTILVLRWTEDNQGIPSSEKMSSASSKSSYSLRCRAVFILASKYPVMPTSSLHFFISFLLYNLQDNELLMKILRWISNWRNADVEGGRRDGYRKCQNG